MAREDLEFRTYTAIYGKVKIYFGLNPCRSGPLFRGPERRAMLSLGTLNRLGLEQKTPPSLGWRR
jgi:hypothetical protein